MNMLRISILNKWLFSFLVFFSFSFMFINGNVSLMERSSQQRSEVINERLTQVYSQKEIDNISFLTEKEEETIASFITRYKGATILNLNNHNIYLWDSNYVEKKAILIMISPHKKKIIPLIFCDKETGDISVFLKDNKLKYGTFAFITSSKNNIKILRFQKESPGITEGIYMYTAKDKVSIWPEFLCNNKKSLRRINQILNEIHRPMQQEYQLELFNIPGLEKEIDMEEEKLKEEKEEKEVNCAIF